MQPLATLNACFAFPPDPKWCVYSMTAHLPTSGRWPSQDQFLWLNPPWLSLLGVVYFVKSSVSEKDIVWFESAVGTNERQQNSVWFFFFSLFETDTPDWFYKEPSRWTSLYKVGRWWSTGCQNLEKRKVKIGKSMEACVQITVRWKEGWCGTDYFGRSLPVALKSHPRSPLPTNPLLLLFKYNRADL